MIRRANLQDADDIAALWNDIIENTTATFTTTRKTTGEIAELIRDPARAVQVAQNTNGFAGFGLIGPFRAGPGYAHTVEHSIYIGPEARGLGIGAALMQALERAAFDAGHHLMVAGISGSNAGAIAFHERRGFVLAGRLAQAGRKGDDWHDLVLMQKFVHNGH